MSINVYVSSASQLKHEVIKSTFKEAVYEVETTPVPTSSGVSEQPASIEETYEGARNRHDAMV